MKRPELAECLDRLDKGDTLGGRREKVVDRDGYRYCLHGCTTLNAVSGRSGFIIDDRESIALMRDRRKNCDGV